MVVKSDQERVRALLAEAISVLCKSGLNYKTEFSIEGLLGITVDSDDIFLVSIKETIFREHIEPELPPKDDKPVNSTKRRARHRKSTPRHRQLVLSAESNDYQSDMWTLSPMADSSIQGDFQNCEVGSTASLDSKRNILSREGTPHSHGSSPCHTSPSSPKDEPHRDITPQKRKQCNDTIHLFSTSNHLDPNPSLSQNSTHETLVIKHEQDLDCEVNVMDTSETDLHLYPMTFKKGHLETTAYDLSVSAALPSLTGLLSGQGPRPGCSAWQASLAGGRSPAASQTQSSVTAASLFSQPPQDKNNGIQEEEKGGRPVLKVPLYSISGKLKREAPQEKANKDHTKPPLKASKLSLDKKGLFSLDSDGANSCPDKENTDLGESKENNQSIENSLDSFYGFHAENGNQDNIEIFTIDSDDDDFKKPEEFIERFQGPDKTMSYKCKLCDKVYSNKWNCRRHIHYTHMNKSGYTCEICHNRYRDRSDYQEHMTVIHQGPGGYKCEFCDKVLMSKRSLKEHISVHTGQYRYHCVECSRGFNRLNEYQQHMSKDHGVTISNISAAVVALSSTI